MEYLWVKANDLKLIESLENEHDRIGKPATIDTDSAWKFVENIIIMWARRYPNEFKEFLDYVQEKRESVGTKYGTKDTPGRSGQMRYLAVIPIRVNKLLKIFFREQVFDQEFMRQFARRIPAMRIAEKI